MTRRRFLKTTSIGAAGMTLFPNLFHGSSEAGNVSQRSIDEGSGTEMSGVVMVTSTLNGKPRIDLISLKNNRILETFEDIHVSHAVVPVEALHRFFVHGRHSGTGKGVIWGLEIDLQREEWRVIYENQLEGGLVLHWQPNKDYSLIQYNTVEDHALHVLDTKTLQLQTYRGGGTHSNMAFFNNSEWLVATDHLRNGTMLRVIDRATNKVLSETKVGDWGHGVTVNDKTERAFVWATDGVHVVSLARLDLGEHLGIIRPDEQGQRSWFCWTPQGSRYSHDQTWNPGDIYRPWLTVIDMENNRLERIQSGSEEPGILQISPDGKFGVCGSFSSNNACLFDTLNNVFLGTVGVGNRNNGFFDRDVSFSRDRKFAFISNPPDKTISVIDIQQRRLAHQIDLPSKPKWMKVLS